MLGYKNNFERVSYLGITTKNFGKLPEKKTSNLYVIENPAGMRVSVTDIGCSIVSVYVPDGSGGLRDVVFGFNNAAAYTVNKAFFGCAVGRVANRIKDGEFELDGKKYELEKNDGGKHHLHGGASGFDKRVWEVLSLDSDNNKITFKYVSPDGDAGYPGELSACITYTLKNDNRLLINYSAETDTKTVCNLTNHSYFNLSGHGAGSFSNHEMQIFSDKLTAVDGDLIPTGEYTDVTGTPYDFRTAKPLNKDLEAAGGYDNNFVLNNNGFAARVSSPESGIVMEVYTDSPGIQLYTGNFLDGSIQGKDGVYYNKHSGFCLETQLFPDAVHQPGFPSVVLTKEKPQKYYTEFAFSVI